MRRLYLLVLTLVASLSAVAQGYPTRAEWKFTKDANNASLTHFTTTGLYPAASGAEGAMLSFWHKGKRITCGVVDKNGFPIAEAAKGDYWLFELPVEGGQKGLVADIYLPFLSDEGVRNNFVLEYRDGGRWCKAVNCRSTISHKHPERLWESVRLKKYAKDGKLQLRLRRAEKGTVTATIASPSVRGQYPQVVVYSPVAQRDTLSILFIGNSYTYYHNYPLIFKEIAWHEGHYADCKVFVSGGYTMKAHLANPHSCEKVDMGGYDCVMLQDQSVLPMLNGTADDAYSTEYLKQMVERVKKSSSDAKVFVEITWGRRFGNNNLGNYKGYADKYPDYFANYDAMQNRLAEAITAEASHCGIALHPLGYAWQIVMHERPDINLYHTDNHHQSYAGSYLAAAVAYLAIYGEKFGPNPADCKLDTETAAYLRSVAERVVLGGEKWGEK